MHWDREVGPSPVSPPLFGVANPAPRGIDEFDEEDEGEFGTADGARGFDDGFTGFAGFIGFDGSGDGCEWGSVVVVLTGTGLGADI
jgi:hypothetical protein